MAGWRGMATMMQPAMARPISTVKQLSGVTAAIKPPAPVTGNKFGTQARNFGTGLRRFGK